VALIDDDNDLLVRDSSIWERHWYDCFPNGRKQFTYSSIQAVAGLRVATTLSGDPTYTAAAERIRGGLLGPASEGGPVLFWETPAGDTCPLLASAPQEICTGCGPYDGAVIELINHEVVRPQSSLAVGTLLGVHRALQMGNGSPGFLRNDDGSGTTNPFPWYDDQEWVVIDLRMATATARVAAATGDETLRANAETLVAWVTAQALANHGLIAELLSDGTWTADDDADHVRPGVDMGMEYQGAVPMCGFGPGAYILALEVLHD
jgi:GH15 family glucan-1,4-alpha-glucosidase